MAKIKSMKTLTRKSIKPTRLFQTEQQKRLREAEKDEEAVTDIEGESANPTVQAARPITPIDGADADEPASPPPSGRSLRSTAKKDNVDSARIPPPRLGKVNSRNHRKSSPFDSWKRFKAGTPSIDMAGSKTRKRGVPDVVEDDVTSASKKAKVHRPST